MGNKSFLIHRARTARRICGAKSKSDQNRVGLTLMGKLRSRVLHATFLLVLFAGPALAGTYENALLSLINEYRAANSLKPLSMRPEYVLLAKKESMSMLNTNRVSHDGFYESFQKAVEIGANGCVENVAWNFPTPNGLFAGWQRSNVHDRNLLHPVITSAGIANVGSFITFFACY